MARYEQLLAWQRAHDLALAVYRTTRSWPETEKFGLVSQARRAASSVGANIAEGAARMGPREFKRFLHIALGSLGELQNHLRLAVDLGMMPRKEWQDLMQLHHRATGLVILLAKSMTGKSEGQGRK